MSHESLGDVRARLDEEWIAYKKWHDACPAPLGAKAETVLEENWCSYVGSEERRVRSAGTVLPKTEAVAAMMYQCNAAADRAL